VMRIRLERAARTVLFIVAGLFLLMGLVLTVTDISWLPALKLGVPNIGWTGVFAIAVIFDWIAAILAFFVLRRMPVPAGGERPSVADAAVRP